MQQGFSVYTMMLILSLIALLTACVLLWMELSSYGSWPQWKWSRQDQLGPAREGDLMRTDHGAWGLHLGPATVTAAAW